jgi:hypothetical protein
MKRSKLAIIGTIALLMITQCTSKLAEQSGSMAVEFPADAMAGQSGTIELTIPAIAASVTSVPPNAVVCDTTLTPNSGGESLNCAFGAVGNGSVTVNVAVTSASGQTTTYSATGNISLPSTPVTQDTFSVAITNPQTNSTATVTSSTSSGGMPSTVMKLSTAVSLQGSVVAPGSIETLNWGDGSSQVIDEGTVNLTHIFANPGSYTLNIAAAGGGAAGSLSVALQVACDSSIPPMVAANPAITASVVSGSDNHYNFTANVSGGSGNFTSLWSPDGSQVYREPAAQGLSSIYYVDYSGNRNIQVIVTDVSCGTQMPLSLAYNFAIPTSNGTPGQAQGPQVGDVAFVQGLLASTSSANASDPRANGFMAILQAVVDPAPNRLVGNYQTSTSATFPATFSVTASTSINDNRDGIALNATFDSSGNMTVQNLTVYVAGNAELGSQLYDSYSSSSCVAQGTVTPIMGQNPCTPGVTGNVTLGYTIDYTYSCPVLTDSAGNTMSLSQGAGYYVVDTSSGTCGGGGQGGGNAPPAF